MCGILGILSKSKVDVNLLKKMNNSLSHRGPDGSGIMIDENLNFGIAHRRLSILDLSDKGSQPMLSHNKQWLISFNGEIYNHKILRKELEKAGYKISWKGTSDTETLLTLIEKLGLKKTLKKISGMFAFGLWDKQKKELFLCKDRIGEKPLYYGYIKDSFIFTSELKALEEHPMWDRDIDRTSLSQFIRYSFVPSPNTIYKKIKKLPPAHFIKISNNGESISDPMCYWDVNEFYKNKNSPSSLSQIEILDNVEKLIINSVNLKMLADVPVGAFLSGGIDSSYIVALMQSLSEKKIKTFSIGNIDQHYDEAPKANKIAKHLGTDHEHLYIETNQIQEIIPKIPEVYDEPFADASQIPTLMVSQLAKKQVKVCLSGDGGDEIFGGYQRYLFGPKIWSFFKHIPYSLRKIISNDKSKFIFLKLYQLLKFKKSNAELQNQIYKVLSSLEAKNSLEFYKLLRTFSKEENIILNHSNQNLIHSDSIKFDNLTEEFIYYDIKSYLPDDILTKVDRASMSVGLEVRTPYLDHNLIEHCINLPTDYKIRDNERKWILKKLLKKHLPNEYVTNKKMGFNLPIGSFLRGPLREWAENLLNKKRIQEQGFLNSKEVRKKWSQFLKGQDVLENQIWCILMFQSWINKNK